MKKGTILVFIQFILIFLIFYFGALNNYYRYIGAFIGVAVGLWAIIAMRFRVSVFPEPLQEGELTLSGPYKYIRHPMYTAVLLTTLSFVNSPITLAFWLVLIADLSVKIHYEEKLLNTKFKSYDKYQKTTKKLIPYIY